MPYISCNMDYVVLAYSIHRRVCSFIGKVILVEAEDVTHLLNYESHEVRSHHFYSLSRCLSSCHILRTVV